MQVSINQKGLEAAEGQILLENDDEVLQRLQKRLKQQK